MNLNNNRSLVGNTLKKVILLLNVTKSNELRHLPLEIPQAPNAVELKCLWCYCVHCPVTDAQETEERLPGDKGSELLLPGHVWGLDCSSALLPRTNWPPGTLVCG